MASTSINSSRSSQKSHSNFWSWLGTSSLTTKLVATVWSLSEPFGIESSMD